MRNGADFSTFRIILARWGWLLLIVLIYLCIALTHFDKPISPDVVRVYLPFAQKVLEQGPGFLLQPESIIVAPVTYLWLALLGGKVAAVKYANLAGGILMVLLTYGIGRQLHSRLAGFIAAFLFAISPFLVRFIPTALSEPPFFLFTLAWVWGLGEIIAEKKWAIPIAAIALSLSILTRPVWLYPSIMFLVFALLWIVLKPAARKTASYLAVAISLGLIIPIFVIIKNLVLFGLPAIESGSGGALFYGAHLMTHGFEPPLLGLAYENGSNDIHSIMGNREHASVAMQFFKERSLFELGDWYLTKVSWLTLFTTLDAPIIASVWRAMELAMALIGIWWGVKQRNAFILLIGMGIVLQILQTAFVLYNIRYSTDNLELLLIPLVAVGIVLSLNIGQEAAKKKESGSAKKNFFELYKYGITGAAIAATLFVALYFRTVPIISLPPHIPVSILFESTDIPIMDPPSFSGERASGRHVEPGRYAGRYVEPVRYIELDVPKQILPPGVGNALWKIKMTISPVAGGYCNKSAINFTKNYSLALPFAGMAHGLSMGSSWFKPPQNQHTERGEVYFNVYDDGMAHTYLLGTANSNAGLFPVEPGKLILEFDCSSDVRITINQISLIAPHFIETYFKQAASQ